MTTPYLDLSAREKSVVQMYDATLRDVYNLLMDAHRKFLEAVAIDSQNATLFRTTMNIHEELPIPSGASVNATAGTTNNLYNAISAAQTFIALNVTNKAVFRQMIGSDRCAELG